MGVALAHIQVVTVEYYDPNAAATSSLRFATRGWTTTPSDTPAHTHIRERVVQAIDVNRTLFAPRTTKGRSTVAVGDVILENSDGELDDFVNFAVDGRTLTIERGEFGGVYPADFTTEFVGTMAGVEVTQKEVRLKLRDRHAEVLIPFQTTKYTGAGLGTLEGVAGDLKGKPKPILYGLGLNLPVPCVETAKLIFQVHDGASVTLQNVYDRGVALVDAGSSYASTAALLASGPSAGQFKIYSGVEGTYFRLGSQPDGLVTCDATQGAAAADRTTAQIFKNVLDERAGMSSGDWSASDVTALDSAANYVIGGWWNEEIQIADVLDTIAESVGAAWFVDNTGLFRIQQLVAPTGTAVASFDANDLLSGGLERITPNDPGEGIPNYQCIVRYQRNYTVQATDVAAAVTQARREFIAKEWREAEESSASVQTAHPLAIQSVDDSLLSVEADAEAEATRRQSLRGTSRDFYEFTVPLTDTNAAIDLNDVVELFHTRYHLGIIGSEDGTLLRVLGLQPNALRRELTITAWGPSTDYSNRITRDFPSRYRVTTTGAYRVTAAA